MPRETRLVIFEIAEVLEALNAYRRIHPEVLPAGAITRIVTETQTELRIALDAAEDQGVQEQSIALDTLHVIEMLAYYCKACNIPLPRKGVKTYEVVHPEVMLRITLSSDELPLGGGKGLS